MNAHTAYLEPGYIGKGQSADVLSFLGGVPRLPAQLDFPVCALCGRELTFFFQVAFGSEHPWTGYTLALFAATQCVHEDDLVPELVGVEAGSIQSSFLDSHQRCFRTFVFPTEHAVPRRDYKLQIAFRELKHVMRSRTGKRLWPLSEPRWLQSDETPPPLDCGDSLQFILQVPQAARFETVSGSPRQLEWGFWGPEPSPETFYELFLGQAVYFWGTNAPSAQKVYTFTQRG